MSSRTGTMRRFIPVRVILKQPDPEVTPQPSLARLPFALLAQLDSPIG